MNQETILKEWRKTDHKNLVHFFGEMDLDLSKSPEEIYIVAFEIAENCGYMVDRHKGKLTDYVSLHGPDGDHFILSFNKEGKLFNITEKNSTHVWGIDAIPEYPGYKGGFYLRGGF